MLKNFYEIDEANEKAVLILINKITENYFNFIEKFAIEAKFFDYAY